MYNNPFYGNLNSEIYRNQISQSIQPFNPYLQNFNQYMQNQNSFQQQPSMTIRRVSNIDEAKAAMIDPVGTYFFVDTGAGKIYMKQMKNDGTAEFYIFGIEQPPVQEEKNTGNSLEEINRRLSNIESVLGGMANVQSVSRNGKSNDGDDAKLGTVNAYAADEKNAGSESAGVSKISGNDGW